MTRRDCLRFGSLAGAAMLIGRGAAAEKAPKVWNASHFHRSRKVVRIPEGAIAYLEEGQGPALLLLHGWPLNAFHWRGVIARLSHHRRCIAPDLMGLGYTEVPIGQNLSPMAQASMVLNLLKALSIDQVDLIANDSGTAIAQLLAVQSPASIRSMLLTNGDVHTNSPPAALAPALEAARRGELDQMFQRHLIDPSFAYSPAGLGSICYADPLSLTPDAIGVYFGPLLANARRRHQCQAYGVAFEPNPLPAVKSRLGDFQSPVRMVWGTGDIHFAAAWAYWLDDLFPCSAGVRLVEGAKLFFPEEQPGLIAEEAIRLFALASRKGASNGLGRIT